jgi:glycosyltransferase involved in cell wall biosynthesis
MRFVFVSAMCGSPWGGSEELWSQTAVRLRELGHAVSASMPFWPQLSPRVAALVEKGIKLNVHRSGQSPASARAWSKAMRMLGQKYGEFQWLKRQKLDLVVISQGAIADGLELLRFCEETALPFAVIVQCNAESWWPTDKVVTGMADAFPAARRLFCVSRTNMELLERQIGESLPNAEIVINPCNVAPDRPMAWPLETSITRMASVARMDPAAKGQDLLFQLLAQPRWRERAIEVNMYGSGPCEVGVRRLAEKLRLKMVRFHGHLDNVAAIWDLNHLLVLPSRFEGLPLALVEAMWCGRPSVVTDVGGNAELCVHGETGFVAAAPTASIFEQTMEVAWDHRTEWRKMGEAARLRADKLFPRDPIGHFARQLISCAEEGTSR